MIDMDCNYSCSIDIRKANEEDMNDILSIIGKGFYESIGSYFESDGNRTLQLIQDSINDGAYYIIALIDNRRVGRILIDTGYDYLTGEQVGWISEVYVDIEFRNRGIATMLMDSAIRDFKDMGFREVRLNVNSISQEAMGLYRNAGFKEVSAFMGIKIL